MRMPSWVLSKWMVAPSRKCVALLGGAVLPLSNHLEKGACDERSGSEPTARELPSASEHTSSSTSGSLPAAAADASACSLSSATCRGTRV